MKKLVFFDRDGVVNLEDHPYTHTINDFHFEPNFFSFFKSLKNSGAICFLITNQSGINRGYFTQKDLEILHNFMEESIFRECQSGFDRIYFCPHTPEDNCLCRKPKPGMILQALKDFNLNLEDFESYFIGDSITDMQAAQSAKITHRILINLKGVPLECEAATDIVKNLKEASKIVLK